ncbi:MAG: hypothetical protein MRERV_68c004 [Mycoplasmataceae bacterium RV_VA103A]|nr:MAG: hypothetical protein MRERV_68c004 [Mycoplasmataceae bacterium RV_VA103A]
MFFKYENNKKEGAEGIIFACFANSFLLFSIFKGMIISTNWCQKNKNSLTNSYRKLAVWLLLKKQRGDICGIFLPKTSLKFSKWLIS